MDAAADLLKLAEKKFGKLTPAEKKLFRKTAEGEIADYSPRGKKPIDPANAAKWGPTRVLRAGRIAWLCTDRQASQLVTHYGIQIKGARIDEKLDLLYAKIPFHLYFDQCKFTADISLLHAQIAGLNMPGTHIGLLSADGLKAEYVYLRNGFRAEGEVRLLGAVIAGNLECGNAQFINKGGKALSADGLNVAGNVFLSCGLEAVGEVCLLNAVIGGNLECDSSQFINQDGRALNASVSKVNGNVFLRDGFKAKGTVSFVEATIRGRFCLTSVDSPGEMELVLDSAKLGTLHDDQESWPRLGGLSLHGMDYGKISQKSPRDAETRIKWLQIQKDFSPQPYEQLAKVLRESGDNAGARDVLVAKNKDKADRTELTRAEWFWYRLFGPLIGYGHIPWLAIPLALVIVLFGSMFFKEGYSHGLVTPLSESAYSKDDTGARRVSEGYPVFNSLVYSIDVFVPVVDLCQAKYWLPNANRGSELVPTSSAALCTGGLLLLWLWIETALGWILTTLFLVGITGLVRT